MYKDVPKDRRPRLRQKSAFWCIPPVHGADLKGPLRVDLTRSPHRLAMTAICAQRPSTAASSNRMTPPHRGRSGPDCTDLNSRRPRGSCRGSGAHSPLVRLSQQAQSAQPSAADGRSRPSKRSVRIATPRASMDRGSTSRRSLCSSASSRGEQPPLPTLAGFEFEFVAEDVASQDGSLSTLRWSIVSPRKMRGRELVFIADCWSLGKGLALWSSQEIANLSLRLAFGPSTRRPEFPRLDFARSSGPLAKRVPLHLVPRWTFDGTRSTISPPTVRLSALAPAKVAQTLLLLVHSLGADDVTARRR